MPAVQLRYQKLFDQVAAHAAIQPGGPAAPLSLRHDFLTFLVNPAEHMPPGTHLAAVRDVVNLLQDHRTPHLQWCRGNDRYFLGFWHGSRR